MYSAVECATFGPVEQLRVVERESPPLGPGTVRIAVTACGVNFVDGLFVQGRYQIKPPLPFVPGMEVVGRVVEVGPDAAGPDAAGSGDEPVVARVGDRVFANVGLGGYASEAVVSARQVLLLPEWLSDGRAATFMQSYMTGWYALRERARAVAGDTMLVLGAGSGVGLAAVDIGAALGLHVIAAASTPEKRALAAELGAAATIDSSALDPTAVKDAARAFAASVPGAGERGGVGLVYDPVGGELGTTCLRALGEDGQYLVIGFVGGIPQLPANQVLLRNRRVTGVDWGAWAGRNAAANRAMLDEVMAAIERGVLHPVEPATYPLAEAATALADLAARKVSGKVALVP